MGQFKYYQYKLLLLGLKMFWLTSKVRSIGESRSNLSVASENRNDAIPYKVHFCTESRYVYNDITGLINLVLQLGDHVVDEVRVCVSEKWDRGNQRLTVVVDYLLQWQIRRLRITVVIGNDGQKPRIPITC